METDSCVCTSFPHDLGHEGFLWGVGEIGFSPDPWNVILM